MNKLLQLILGNYELLGKMGSRFFTHLEVLYTFVNLSTHFQEHEVYLHKEILLKMLEAFKNEQTSLSISLNYDNIENFLNVMII